MQEGTETLEGLKKRVRHRNVPCTSVLLVSFGFRASKKPLTALLRFSNAIPAAFAFLKSTTPPAHSPAPRPPRAPSHETPPSPLRPSSAQHRRRHSPSAASSPPSSPRAACACLPRAKAGPARARGAQMSTTADRIRPLLAPLLPRESTPRTVHARRAQALRGARALLRGRSQPSWHWSPPRCSRWCRGHVGPHRCGLFLDFFALCEVLLSC